MLLKIILFMKTNIYKIFEIINFENLFFYFLEDFMLM